MPFFNAWEFHGKFPAILEDEIVGEAASQLYKDAREMLDRIVDENWIPHEHRAWYPGRATEKPTAATNIYDPRERLMF